MDLDKIENIMKLDAGLMYKFIRFINSASNGFVERVSNIKQSIMLIGEDPFRKWILLFFYSDLSGEDNEEYTNKAAIRGRFCELIMEKIDRSKKNDAFIFGLLLDINLLLISNCLNNSFVTLVSSDKTTSAVFKTFIALKVMSSKFPIGVGTKYKDGLLS